MFQRRQRRHQDNLGVYMLAYQLMSAGPIPPITLGAILIQVAVFLGFVPMLDSDRTRAMCLLPQRVLERKEWIRLLAPVIMHGDDMHLYYNMISFLYKGRKLESRFGAFRFLVILVLFSIASTLMTVALSFGLDTMLEDGGYMYQCAVGFSGVIFALKVLMNAYFPYENNNLFGWFPISPQYACWAELVLIQLLTPNASFVGHLAGILVGLLYTWGPLKFVTDAICAVAELDFGGAGGAGVDADGRPRPSAPNYSEDEGANDNNRGWFGGRGATVGGTQRAAGGDDYRAYTGGMSEDEQMRRAMAESLNGGGGGARRRNAAATGGYGWNLD